MYKRKLKEYQELKLKVDEFELNKEEELQYTKMKLEENSKIQMNREFLFIKKEIESNDDLAIHYLKLYMRKLKEELE